jgi:hypothetical protein
MMMFRGYAEGFHMLRTGLIAVLLLGLGSTAMASDRVRVNVGIGSYYGDVGYHFSYVDGGRGDRRWNDRHRYDRRWDDRRGYYGRDSWRNGRYYSAPRGYYYPKPYYGPSYRGSRYGQYYGYPRGHNGGRYFNDRRHDDRRWHRH